MSISAPARAVPADGGDGELVARARRGELAAIEELYRRHRAAAYRLALQLLGDPDEAQDAAQDALLSFFDHLGRFQPGRPVRPWLFTIVRNRCRDLLRRRRVRRAEAIDGDEERWRPELVDAAADPHGDAERAQLQRRVWRALAELQGDHREILVLRDYHDLSYAEIAEVLSVPLGTVMSRLHRARRQMAAALGPLQPTRELGHD